MQRENQFVGQPQPQFYSSSQVQQQPQYQGFQQQPQYQGFPQYQPQYQGFQIQNSRVQTQAIPQTVQFTVPSGAFHNVSSAPLGNT